MKILVIRFSSLGDILLTTPIIRALRNKFPDAVLDMLVKKEYSTIYEHNPNISSLLTFHKDQSKILSKSLQESSYDLVIDLQNNWRSRRLTSGLKCEISRVKKPTIKKLLLVHFKINLLKNSMHIVERYALAASVNLDQKGLELFLPADLEIIVRDSKKNIGLCPGAKHFTKCWPMEYYAELGNKLIQAGYHVLIFGGKSDLKVCDDLSSLIKGAQNLQNEDDLFRTAANMKQCRALITNDSGLMHTASAVGVPVVSFFGGTVKEFGFTPFRIKNLILENNSLSCRPCSHIGKSKCPKGHFKCMKEISPSYAFTQIQKFIKDI